MKKMILIFVFLSISFVLFSCGDDNPTGGNQTTLLPTKSGTYWVYINYMLDSNNNRMQGNPTMDSTVVDGTITLNDTTGSIFITYNIDSTGISISDSVYYHTDKMKVFVYSNYFTNLMGNLPFPLDISISKQWVKLVDSEDEDWRVIEQEIPDTQIFPGLVMSGTVTILGTSAGTETIVAESQNYNTRKFILKMTFAGNIKISTYTLPLNLERKTYLYFADNVGLIKSIIDPMKIELFQMPGTNLPGEEKILIRHHIAN